jgi:hypothetical protein
VEKAFTHKEHQNLDASTDIAKQASFIRNFNKAISREGCNKE